MAILVQMDKDIKARICKARCILVACSKKSENLRVYYTLMNTMYQGMQSDSSHHPDLRNCDLDLVFPICERRHLRYLIGIK